MRFRPPLWPTVASASLLALLIGLGNWQMRRHRGAVALRATIGARMAAPEVDEGALAATADELAWRRAALAGTWTADPPMLLAGQFAHEQRGYRIVQLLETDTGLRVLVDRGWIPAEGYSDTVRRVAAPPGTTTVRGLLERIEGDPDQPPVPTSPEDPSLWVPPGLAAMAHAAGPGVAPIVLRAGEPTAAGPDPRSDALPIPAFDPYPKRIDHLQYAATWYGSALLLVWAWILLGLRRGRQRDASG